MSFALVGRTLSLHLNLKFHLRKVREYCIWSEGLLHYILQYIALGAESEVRHIYPQSLSCFLPNILRGQVFIICITAGVSQVGILGLLSCTCYVLVLDKYAKNLNAS